jgi:archaellum component FlaC
VTFAESMTLVAVGLSAINAVILLKTYHRAGQWRESEDAKAILTRLTVVENDITGFKTRFENVSTKADVARLTAEVNGLEQLIKGTDAGVVRIEQILMRGTK